jgi:phosphoesterase RecJ-like protein
MSHENLLRLLQEKHRFVLTTHVNPDGDGIGSEQALASALRRAGKSVQVINHSPTPAVYDFLDPGRTIQLYDPRRDDAVIAGADVICVLDTNQPDRLRSMECATLASPAFKVVVDHHLDPAPFANLYLVDDAATSTGEIIYRLILGMGEAALTPEVAQALYAAILTDTGSFRYPRVNAGTHRIVAHLIEAGADPVAIYSNVYERWSAGRIHLLGEMLARLVLNGSGTVASVAITRDMLERTGTSEEDTDNFTSYLMSLSGVRAGLLFLEMPEGVKISFRSRGEIAINELAKEFGGNGHRNAAGARIDRAPLDDVVSRVTQAAERYV